MINRSTSSTEILEDNLYRPWNRIELGSYMPLPVRRVDISKGEGKNDAVGSSSCL